MIMIINPKAFSRSTQSRHPSKIQSNFRPTGWRKSDVLQKAAPYITLPIVLNPKSSVFDRFSDLSDCQNHIQVMVNEYGDGIHCQKQSMIQQKLKHCFFKLLETEEMSSEDFLFLKN